MYAELPQEAQTISYLQQCRYLRQAMPPNWQDKLALVETRDDSSIIIVTFIESVYRVGDHYVVYHQISAGTTIENPGLLPTIVRTSKLIVNEH